MAEREGGDIFTFLTTFCPYMLNSKRLSCMHSTVGAASMAMLLAARTRHFSRGHLYLFAPCTFQGRLGLLIWEIESDTKRTLPFMAMSHLAPEKIRALYENFEGL